jgi:hypothetical protein
MDAINKEAFKTPGGYVYSSQKVRYSNLQSGVVATYATKALLVARNFKDPNKVKQLVTFRDAALKAIPTLPDQAGTHPQWANVLPGTKSAWPMWTGK